MPDPGDVVSWPQAVVAVAVVLVLGVVPAVGGWLAARRARDTATRVEDTLTTNNGGGHVKDSLDELRRAAAETNARLADLSNRVADVTSGLSDHVHTADQRDSARDAHLADQAARITRLERGHPRRRRRWWRR